MSDIAKSNGTGAAAPGDEEFAKLTPRERILQSSLKLFVEQGYFNTNVPDISKASRCSVGSIYHHFLNKEEIADQLYRDGIQQFRKALSEAIDPAGDLETTVRALVEAFLNFAERNHQLSRYLWLSRHNEFLTQKVAKPTVIGFDSFGKQLTRVLKKGIRSGQIPSLKAEIVWVILFGTALSFVRDWLEDYTTLTPSEVAPVISKASWTALQSLSQKP